VIYFVIFCLLVALLSILQHLTKGQRSRILREALPYVLTSVAAAIAVFAVILIANGGGQFRVL
jgi:hypothetical protein